MISVCIETLDPDTGEVLNQRNVDLEFLDLSGPEGRRRFSRWVRREGIREIDRTILRQMNAPEDFEVVEARPVPLGSLAAEAYAGAIASARAVRERAQWERENGLIPFGSQVDREGRRTLTRVVAGAVDRPLATCPLVVSSKTLTRGRRK